ncbi:hypothetical protein DRQ33_00575 [bacterium]|nr:MAG: hypothetical protein DRQ33_00575 [bacterium]
MKNIGLIISGIGYEDGSSIWDIAYILRQLEIANAKPIPLVPRESVERKIPGLRRKQTPIRDFRQEGQLIVRGEVYYIDEFEHRELDALIIPGGKGPVSVLSSILRDGSEALVLPEIREFVAGIYARKKPLAGIGYGASLIAFILRASVNTIITVGDDTQMIEFLKRIGTDVIKVQPDEVVFDEENNILSTPGTNPNSSLYRASQGIEMLVKEVANIKVNP